MSLSKRYNTNKLWVVNDWCIFENKLLICQYSLKNSLSIPCRWVEVTKQARKKERERERERERKKERKKEIEREREGENKEMKTK
jgi:hypothetical protein